MKRRKFGTKEHMALLELLRDLRVKAGFTQVELAKALRSTQVFVSKYELGERRLDVLEARTVAIALGISFSEFAKLLEAKLGDDSQPSSTPRKSKLAPS